jgi:hypothetical protein
MSGNTAPRFAANANIGTQTFVNADGTASKVVFTAGSNGSRLDALNIASTDTAAHDVQVLLNIGGSDVPIGTINVAIGAGNSSTVNSKNVLADPNLGLTISDPYGNRVLELPAAATVKLAMAVAVTSGKTVSVTAMGGDL